jgi:hypothetical protein
VWVIGGLPDWTVNVNQVPWKSRDKWVDLTKKWHHIPGEVSDVFYYWEDDYYLCKPVESIPLVSVPWRLPKNGTGTEYQETLVATRNILVAAGIEHPLSFDAHVPMPVEKDRIPLHLDSGRPVRFRTLTGNYSTLPVVAGRDVKVRTQDQLVARVGGPFLSSHPMSFEKSGVAGYLVRLFPDPCEYEA